MYNACWIEACLQSKSTYAAALLGQRFWSCEFACSVGVISMVSFPWGFMFSNGQLVSMVNGRWPWSGLGHHILSPPPIHPGNKQAANADGSCTTMQPTIGFEPVHYSCCEILSLL
jgi:hypothetical protein